jgi:serine/threonine-protein kinase
VADESPQQFSPERTDDPAVEAAGSSQLPELVPEDDALLGTVVGDRYLLCDLIGRGGMGAVYRAEHIHMRKVVALKVLHRELTANEEVVLRFEREAIAAGSIEHANVVQAHDFGRLPDGAFYLVLEYVEGTGLGQALLDAGGQFDVERALNIAGQIAEALVAAHAQGVVHRDLKPDNVMLVAKPGEPEIAKVMDFGIAKIGLHERIDPEKQITQVGSVFGTPEYMSPEQAAGQSVDARGDLYSMGLLLYRMLAGSPPFSAGEVQAVLMMQITQPPPELPQSVPEPVKELVLQLLAKLPDERIQTAQEVLGRILELLGSETTASVSKTRAKLVSVGHVDSGHVSWLQRSDRRSRAGRVWTFRGYRVPVWRMVSVASLAMLGGAALVAWVHARRPLPVAQVAAGTPEPRLETSAPMHVTGQLPAAEDPDLERLLGKVFVGDKDAVLELERKPAEQRSVQEWVALARGLAKNRRMQDALDAYSVALDKQPSVSEDAVLRRDITNAAREPETAERALRLAAAHLGADGADLLYKVWVDTREVTAATSLARELLYQPEVRQAASPALQFLLAWREAIGCDEYRKLLPDATLHADRRALTLFNRAKLRNQCGLTQEAIEAAIVAAKDRQQPAPY